MSAALFYLQLALASMGLADPPADPPPEPTEATRPATTNESSAAKTAESAETSQIYNGF